MSLHARDRFVGWVVLGCSVVVGWLCASGLALAQQVKYLDGHTDAIYAVTYSPNGKWLVSGGFDNTAKLWDRAKGQVLRSVTDHTSLVLTVAVSADSLQWASGSSDRTVRLYDLPNRDPLADFGPQPGDVLALALSADGKWIATADSSKAVRIFEAASQKHQRDLPGLVAEPTDAAFAPNGAFVLVSAADGSVRGWNPTNGQELGAIHFPRINSVAIGPDSKVIALAGEDGVLRTAFWPPIAPKKLGEGGAPRTTAAVSLDNQWAATGSADGHVRVHNTSDGGQLKDLDAGAGAISALAAARDNQSVAAGTAQGLVKIFKVSDGSLSGQVEAHPGAVRDLAYHPNGQQIATAGEDGLVRFWLLPLSPARDSQPHPKAIRGLAITSDNATLATAGEDNAVKLVKLADGSEIRTLSGNEAQVWSVAFSVNNQQVATGGDDQKLRLFNAGDGNLIKAFDPHGAALRSVAIHPNQQELAAGGANNLIKIWKAADGSLVRELKGHSGPILGLAYLPNGSQILSIGGNDLKFWQTSDGKDLRNVGVGTAATSLAISRDGNLAAVGGADQKVRVYKTSDGSLQMTLDGAGGAVKSVSFSNDGKRVLASFPDKSARLWDLASGDELQRFALPSPASGSAWASDGKSVAFAREDGQLSVRCVAAVKILKAHTGAVTSLAYTTSGSHLLTGGFDKGVHLWNLTSGQKERTFGGVTDQVLDVAVSADTNLVAAGGKDKNLRLWKFGDASPVAALVQPASVHSVAFSPDNQKIVCGCEDRLARLYFLSNQALGEQFTGLSGAVASVAYSANSQFVALSGSDGQSRLWSPTVQRAAKVHEGRINRAVLASNGAQILTCGQDRLIALWNTFDLNQVRKFEGATAAVKAVDRSNNNQYVVAGGDDQQLRLWNFQNGQLLATVGLGTPVLAVTCSDDAKVVLASAADKSIRNYSITKVNNVDQLLLAQDFLGHAAPAFKLALSTDTKTLFSGGPDKSVKRWGVARGDARFNLTGHQDLIYALAFSPDGARLASASADKTVKLWSTVDGKNLATCTGHGSQVYGVAFSPDGQQIASCSSDKTLRLWNAAGKSTKEFKDEIVEGLYSVTYSPQGDMLLTAGLAKTWQLFRPAAEKPEKTVSGHPDYIYKAIYNAAGNRVATIGFAGHLKIWDASSGQLLHEQKMESVAFSLAYAPDGRELAVATQDRRLLLVTIPPKAQ